MSSRIYLDHNATSPLRPQARDAMIAALGRDGNASSVHREGRAQRQLIENAREQIAALVGCDAAEVVFTSGATEANNIALGAGWDTIYRAGIEHESVLMPAQAGGAQVLELPVRVDGIVDNGALGDAVAAGAAAGGRGLLSLQMANNETGICQDVRAAAEICREHGVKVHTDAVQACGRIAVDFEAMGADLLSLSSHKIGGPMGVGALIIRRGFELRPLIQGGGQERRRRAGTENVAAIAGFGAAAEAASADLQAEYPRLRELRDHAEAELLTMTQGVVVIGHGGPRLPNTICVALPGDLAETSVIKADLAGIAISAGSACSSGKVGASHVLSAIGVEPDLARTAIRISLGWNTTRTCLEEFLSRFRGVLKRDVRAVA